MALGTKLRQASVMVLCFCGGAEFAQCACTPPAPLAQQLRATPTAVLYASLGTWYADHKQFDCAAGTFGKAAALQPDSARYQYLLGLSLYSSGQPGKAVAPLLQSLQIEPKSVQAHLALGSTLEATDDRRAAEVQWRLALAADPQSTLAYESLSRDLLVDRNYSAVIDLLKPNLDSTMFTDDLAVDLSVAYSKSGLPQDAIELLKKRLQQKPTSLSLAESLSGVLILQGRFQDAVAVLSPIAKQHPSDMHVQILYLQTLVLAHDPGAGALGQRLLALDPHHWELLYFMGMLQEQGDDYASAGDYFRRSVAGKPDYADAHSRLGIVQLALNDPAAAKEELQKAIALGLDTPEVHAALAKALRALGDTAAAQEQFALYRQRLQAQAARAQAADKAQQGDQAQAAGDLQQTAQYYREAFALDPHEPVLAYKLALALDKVGDHAGERKALETTIALDPQMAAAQNQLGYLDASESNDDKAVHEFQLAVQADAGFTRAWLNLAATLCLEAKWAEAREAVNHLLELDARNANARSLLQQIDAMQAKR